MGNLKLELTEYSRHIYGLGGFAYPDDDDGNAVAIQRLFLATSQGRGTSDDLANRQIDRQT